MGDCFSKRTFFYFFCFLIKSKHILSKIVSRLTKSLKYFSNHMNLTFAAFLVNSFIQSRGFSKVFERGKETCQKTLEIGRELLENLKKAKTKWMKCRARCDLWKSQIHAIVQIPQLFHKLNRYQTIIQREKLFSILTLVVGFCVKALVHWCFDIIWGLFFSKANKKNSQKCRDWMETKTNKKQHKIMLVLFL